ncbi:MAG: ATP-binding cassette domain-containing protein [Geminicoccaceae bacterium]|nr:ATP-binding cassette domain-containing protein [Geminicoccaceae bacterium]
MSDQQIIDSAEPAAVEEAFVIEARALTKKFGEIDAVRGIDLTIPKGRCIGLLGPNGAGKTTTMRMIMGLTRPTSGSVTVLGEEASRLPRSTRARIGLVPQDNNLDPDLSVRQNLEVFGRYYGLLPAEINERVPQLLDFMQLSQRAKSPVMGLSGGMQRRLILARAVIGNPDLIILDEPTTGLDPQARVMIWRQLLVLKNQAKTLLLTTHYMDEAERLCDDIVLIDNGRILDQGTPRELIRRHVKPQVIEIRKPLPRHLPLSQTEDLGDSVLLFVDDAEAVIRGMPAETSFQHRPANLEDVFLRLTGRQLREN